MDNVSKCKFIIIVYLMYFFSLGVLCCDFLVKLMIVYIISLAFEEMNMIHGNDNK